MFFVIPAVCEKTLKENNITAEIGFHVLGGEDATEGQFPHMVGKNNRNLNFYI